MIFCKNCSSIWKKDIYSTAYLIIISLAPFAPSWFTLVSDDSVQKKCILHIMHAPQNSAQYLSDFPFITWF